MSGFTIVELLVVIGVIPLLMALLLPAVMNAREAARTLQCKNNMKNLGLAMIMVTESDKQFPAAGYWGLSPPGPYHSWVVTILPWIEQKNIYDKWDRDSPFTLPSNEQLAQIQIPTLLCPSDTTGSARGDLSYVVNGGFGWTGFESGIKTVHGIIDLDGNGLLTDRDGLPKPNDFDYFFQTGLFFIDNWPQSTIRHHSLDTLVDGASQTIMMSENVRTGAPNTNWANPMATRTSFFLSPFVCKSLTCVAGNVDYSRANRGPGSINSSLHIAQGEAPWPSSFHPGGVHVVFADGRVEFLSEAVDGRVYANMVSPQGSLITGPLTQTVGSGGQ
jgi:prepilin-type processing-associated H-X9-DG protein